MTSTFRTAPWLIALGFAALVIGIAGALLTTVEEHGLFTAGGLRAFAIFALVGVADSLTTRIELRDDGLRFVTTFRKRTVPRSDIASVTWEKGGGVYLKLISGGTVALPDTGNSQSRVNSIRAWLEK